MLDKFNAFLDNNKCREAFYKNSLQNEISFEEISKKGKYRYFILDSFRWRGTVEGSIYWGDIHLKWTKYIKENEHLF